MNNSYWLACVCTVHTSIDDRQQGHFIWIIRKFDKNMMDTYTWCVRFFPPFVLYTLGQFSCFRYHFDSIRFDSMCFCIRFKYFSCSLWFGWEKIDVSLPQPYPYRCCGFSSFFPYSIIRTIYAWWSAYTCVQTQKKLIYILMKKFLVPRGIQILIVAHTVLKTRIKL